MKRLAIGLSILMAGWVVAVSPGPKIPANPGSLQELEQSIRQLIARQHPPGLSVAVVREGERVYTQGFGWADGPGQISATPQTVYHWWSMTKIPTALAILQLSQDGLLDLDDPVSQYLGYFQVEFNQQPAPPITIRQLLQHTSGLPDPMPAMIGWVHYEDVVLNQTELLKEHLPRYRQLKFEPGSQSAYSNLGYLVLGAVIEAISGQRYEAYIREKVLLPLGMQQTGFLYTPEMDGQIAAGSHPMVSLYTPLLPFLLDMSDLVRQREGTQLWFNQVYLDVTPSSGLVGSVEDGARLMQALTSPEGSFSVPPFSQMLPQSGGNAGRPLGWAEFSQENRDWVQHSGGGPGFATIMRIYPQEHLAIMIMSNATNLPREALVEAFASLDWTIRN